MDLSQIEQILDKEIQDFAKGLAPTLKVIEVINSRESILKEIENLTVNSEDSDRKIDELERLLIKLR